MKPRKRTVLWIIPLLIIGVFYYFYGPKDEINENAYIDYVKALPLANTHNASIDAALKNYCAEGKWVYFETQKGQHVVEYKGECPQNGEEQPVNWQFIVKDEQQDYTIGVLLLNHIKQEEEQKVQFIQTIYSSL